MLVAGFIAFDAMARVKDHFRETGREAEELKTELDKLAISGEHAGHLLGNAGLEISTGVHGASIELSNFEDVLKTLDSRAWLEWVPDAFEPNHIRQFREEVDNTNAAFEALVAEGNIEQATTQMSELTEGSRDNGRSLEELGRPSLTTWQSSTASRPHMTSHLSAKSSSSGPSRTLYRRPLRRLAASRGSRTPRRTLRGLRLRHRSRRWSWRPPLKMSGSRPTAPWIRCASSSMFCSRLASSP
ncbi:hypothetical protein [Nesterenkonia pannonica]|uniref:hypothetical protein n=1 Tax=Nesterenkonia pannonica TaxID=1548602 RepID=UPI0021645393|nr:hypothetical protein [Nesterenkonia pannonica]